MSDERLLNLFDRINLANCAVKRAEAVSASNGKLFHSEYETVRLWSKHRVYTSAACQFVEP